MRSNGKRGGGAVRHACFMCLASVRGPWMEGARAFQSATLDAKAVLKSSMAQATPDTDTREGMREGDRLHSSKRARTHTSSLKMASIGIPCTPTAADKAERVSASAHDKHTDTPTQVPESVKKAGRGVRKVLTPSVSIPVHSMLAGA